MAIFTALGCSSASSSGGSVDGSADAIGTPNDSGKDGVVPGDSGTPAEGGSGDAGAPPPVDGGSRDARTGDSGGAIDSGLGGNDSAPMDGGALTSCTNPTCVVSNNGCPEGNANLFSWYLYDNQWNCGPGGPVPCGPETIYGCAYNSWYVTSRQPAGNTAVLTFPSIQANFSPNKAVSSFTSITSTFAEQSPHVGDYEVAYDIWFNGLSYELMIWVDNYNQTPAGNEVAMNVALGGVTYDIWSNASSGYMVFYPTTTITSGTLDLLGIFNFAIQMGLLPATAQLSQLTFGVEVCSTNGQDATWYVNDFSVTAN